MFAGLESDPEFNALVGLLGDALNEEVNDTQTFLVRTVEELLFKGFYLEFLEIMYGVLSTAFPENADQIWNEMVPQDMRDFTFAFYEVSDYRLASLIRECCCLQWLHRHR